MSRVATGGEYFLLMIRAPGSHDVKKRREETGERWKTALTEYSEAARLPGSGLVINESGLERGYPEVSLS